MLLLETLSIVACETRVLFKTLVTMVLRHGVSEISDGACGVPFVSVTKRVAGIKVEMAVGAFVTETVIPYCRQNTVFASAKICRKTKNSYSI